MVEVKYKKYEAYKDSGVDWLGGIPSTWQCFRMKRLYKDFSKKNFPEAELLSVTQNQGVVPRTWVENRMVMPSGALESFKLIEKGDFAISLRSFEGGLEYCYHDGIISPAYTVLKKKRDDLYEDFYKYLFKSHAFISELQTSVVGIREGKNISYPELSYSYLPIPPLPEQTAIANFLDNKTAKIDTAIAQKEQLIALLKERKQIIIQNAVTGKTNCLNYDSRDGHENDDLKEKNQSQSKIKVNHEISENHSSRPMKDSGVEWIGEIPEGWEVKALKFIATLESGETISSESFIEEGYPVYGGNGFRGYAQSYTNEGKHALIGRQGALCGNVNYAEGKFFASEHAIVVYHKKGVNVTWLGEAIKSADFNRLSQSAAQPGIAVNVIKNELFPYPSIVEQNKIEVFIETQSTKIDQAIALQQTQIEKLKEYKATLIDGAVTGKIKIV